MKAFLIFFLAFLLAENANGSTKIYRKPLLVKEVILWTTVCSSPEAAVNLYDLSYGFYTVTNAAGPAVYFCSRQWARISSNLYRYCSTNWHTSICSSIPLSSGIGFIQVHPN